MLATQLANAEITHYVRYESDGASHYGVVDGDVIHTLTGPPWSGGVRSGASLKRQEARLLAPAEPRKVFAIGFNYMSHRGDRELPPHPPVFLKLPTAIVGPGAEIIFPAGADDVHYEGELVIVIGKTASRISAAEAPAHVFGVTAGNDVSARSFQAGDLQWFRAKASDTFGPIGPVIATGLDQTDLLLQTRLNGEVMQQQRTSDHIHDIYAIVSHISQYATLQPGDVIFTGTPGTTSAMKPGDTVEIELEGVGVLKNVIGRPADTD
ncbi:MAG: fumarylacetoacetate hydrolase family protein [Gammaproteobacteria bacterium]|nr:fumarylacetoacetate hydrolase family protein [Gammaproteobacteria bacterium]